jgi:uncharacterized protein (TIGR00375 family)
MKFTTDFHIHSHYSRATSPQMNIVSLTKWGQIKGIQVIGTGDFTHPLWFNEMREKLEEAEPGLFKLKKAFLDQIEKEIPESCRTDMRFMLTVEVSTIYSKKGKVRKVHSLLCAPSFQVAAQINAELAKIGNLQADGRPILGLDAKKLLQIVLDASPDAMFMPAHVWTPHFGVLGSSSGFDTLEECFEELTPFLTALETGLSSDPAMNRRLAGLDRFALVSNSDAHSPAKLGREANRFDTDLSYFAIKEALCTNDPQKLMETIEFYPEEGKYHFDGHRNCKISFSPEETAQCGAICPKCGRDLTIGVMNRVEKLADRKSAAAMKVPFRYLVPLPEILADLFDSSPNSKKVMDEYFFLIYRLGNEFDILLDIPLPDIEKASSALIATAIHNVRSGRIHISPGYDGEYGLIQVFTPEERQALSPQVSLF